MIGSWDLEITWFDAQGAIQRTARGEWHFAWVLEGRAVQDVWITPRRAERTADAELYEYGTSLRFYDPELGAWQSTWLGPMTRSVRRFTASRVDEEIHLISLPSEPERLRWSFFNIEDHSFEWRNERDDGDGWRLQQSFRAVRAK